MALALYDKTQNLRLFAISESERDQLVAALQEESSHDHDYYIDANVLDFLEDKCDPQLLAKLRPLVGGSPVAPLALEALHLEAASESDPVPEFDDAEFPGLDIEWREE